MERLIVGLPYRGMVQQCLKKVKYKSAWEVINFLYGLWKARASSSTIVELHPGGVITSVPMWSAKERLRGFNQAKILAELVGKQVDLLERVRATKPMFGLKRKDRAENVYEAFRLRDTFHENASTRIILVDDVWTTGATMRECARVLKRNGISEVWGVTLAR
jgi:ComF family protein